MLQTLFKLIGNTKQAFENLADRSPCVTLDARLQDSVEGRTLCITVSDNGEAISLQNLDRDFSSSFATRKNGHGFRPHSWMLATQGMGGTLTAHSGGLGKGASFLLEMPVGAPESRP